MPNSTERIALDVHAHLVPVREELLAAQEGVVWRDSRLVVDGHVLGATGLFHPEQLVAWMDAQEVERAWVSVPPPVYRQHLSAGDARSWFRYLDEGLTQICGRYAGRLAPLRHLPLEHPSLALEFAAHALESGESRFSVAAGGHDRILYSDPVLGPLWSLLDGVSSFVFIHPGKCCDGRLSTFYLDNLVGNPYETAVAASHLVFGGVCDRHPRIRFCLAHGGGATAMLAGRLQRGHDTKRPGIAVDALAPPKQALRRFWADSITHDPAALALAARVFGGEHLVFGSDWPFPMGLPQPHAQLSDADPDLLQGVLRDNAAGLLAGPG